MTQTTFSWPWNGSLLGGVCDEEADNGEEVGAGFFVSYVPDVNMTCGDQTSKAKGSDVENVDQARGRDKGADYLEEDVQEDNEDEEEEEGENVEDAEDEESIEDDQDDQEGQGDDLRSHNFRTSMCTACRMALACGACSRVSILKQRSQSLWHSAGVYDFGTVPTSKPCAYSFPHGRRALLWTPHLVFLDTTTAPSGHLRRSTR